MGRSITPGEGRATWAEVDLDAVGHNTRRLAALAAPGRLCGVVKADAYGHGALRVATTAVENGASWLAVALVSEGLALRQNGIEVPILVLSEPEDLIEEAVAGSLRLTVYRRSTVDRIARVVAASEGRTALVHLKVDTGMHRVGCSPADAVSLADHIGATAVLKLEGCFTHLAVADEPESTFTALQVARFERCVAELAARGHRPEVLHVANSAGLIAHNGTHFDLVRCGIALYGLEPAPGLASELALRPALRLCSRVGLCKEVGGGEGISYGLRHRCDTDTRVATIPIGYADGVPRRLSSVGGEVLIGGRRRPIIGSITMDQLMVDVTEVDPRSGRRVGEGDEVVLLGEQGGDRVDPWEWATLLDTIAYEVVCGIGPRVPRRYVLTSTAPDEVVPS